MSLVAFCFIILQHYFATFFSFVYLPWFSTLLLHLFLVSFYYPLFVFLMLQCFIVVFFQFCFHLTPLGVWKWQYNSREGGARTMKDLKLKNPFNISMQLKRPQNILLLLHANNKNVAATCEKWYCFQCYLSVAALEHQAATTIDKVVAKCLYPFFVNPCFY